MLTMLFVIWGYAMFMFAGYMVIGEIETARFDYALKNGTEYNESIVNVYNYQRIKYEFVQEIFGGE